MPSFWDNIRFANEEGAQGEDMATYVSHPLPSAGNTFPAIIVVQEAFGVNRHIQKVCDRFAQEGYVAAAPALFHREHPNPQLGYGDNEAPARNRYMSAFRDNEIIEDINATIKYLQEEYPRTRGQKIGIVGYCVGGRIAYLAATSCPGLSAAVVYYGGRILIPFGGQDQNPSLDDVAKIEAKLKEAGVNYDFKTYPNAGHGFNCDERGSYQKEAADDAWARTLSWFGQHVKSPVAVG
jgi:carboxymethylenebutenolidase